MKRIMTQPQGGYRAFTLIELLVTIAIIALLMAILLPCLAIARQQAKVTVVNMELDQIATALEMYMMDNEGNRGPSAQSHPPTHSDCGTGLVTDHLFQIPDVLVDKKYLPGQRETEAMSCVMEDRFHPDHTYKYRAVGQNIVDRGMVSKWIKAKLWVPKGFPDRSRTTQGQWHDDPKSSPVLWVLFSLGLDFDIKEATARNYPVSPESWYDPAERRGIITRVRLRNGKYVGSFER